MHGNVKWDNNQVLSIMEARMSGKSLQQIADEYGCTRENIRQIIGRGIRIVRNGTVNYGDVVYPNIRQYLNESGDSLYSLSKKSGIKYCTLLNYLKKLHDIPLSFAFVIAERTGMTVEEAFALPEGVERPKRTRRGHADEHGD